MNERIMQNQMRWNFKEYKTFIRTGKKRDTTKNQNMSNFIGNCVLFAYFVTERDREGEEKREKEGNCMHFEYYDVPDDVEKFSKSIEN